MNLYISMFLADNSIHIWIEILRRDGLPVITILNVFCGPILFVTSLKAKSSKEKREDYRVYMVYFKGTRLHEAIYKYYIYQNRKDSSKDN